MSAPKVLTRFGLLAKVESAYGTDATPAAATDGVLVTERVDIAPQYMNDGTRGHYSLKRVAKSGRYGSASLVHEFAGNGAAYSAILFPSIHTLMRGAGFDAAGSFVASSEKWTYTPTVPGSYASLTLEAYARGQKSRLTGAYGGVKCDFENGGIPKWAFDFMGIMPALPSDSALPTITYSAAALRSPAKASALTLTLGAFTPIRVKSGSYAFDRGLGARAMDQTNGHGGFTPGGEPKHTMSLVVESTALATFNPYNVAELVQSSALAVQFGGAQYDRMKLTAANAQLIDTPEQDENNAAMWELQLELKPSAFGLYDECTWTAD